MGIYGGKAMEIKYYSFITKKYSQQTAYNSLSFVSIPTILLMTYVGIYFLISKFYKKFIIPHTVNVLIIVVLISIGIFLAYKRCNAFRGVFLFDDYIQIQRYEISSVHPFPINPKILYTDIVSVEKHAWNPQSYNEWNDRQLSIVGGYGLDYIKITNDLDRKYIFCIEKSDEFLEEINKRIKSTKSKENDKRSKSAVPTNMFQFDLQRGYMPDCDEIVLGINGVEFKTDKSTAGLINVKSISYNDIQLCKKSDKHSINGVDSDNIVEIQTPSQTYYIPIKNPYDFINNLYKKLNARNR